ncbi:unnamed protein product [Amaranthus hypochondriacus]
MAAFDHIRDLNDIALKPRLLRSLLKEHLPDETLPFRDPSQLSTIVSIVKTHKLLSEEIPPSTDNKHVSAWKSAVDAWLDRILMLARTNLPDKCWAGVCLLGVTSVECSSARFLASYSDWFNVLLSHIQSSEASQYIRVASCVVMSDVITRLGGFSNLKKDGNSHAGKLVQSILNMFDKDVAEDLLVVAAQLLLAILNNFPSSVHRHYDNAEYTIVKKIMSGDCGADLLTKLSFCLASLPKSKGDEDSWSSMMQKILLSLSSLLNSAFEGLEEETRRGEAVSLLVPPGKDPPPSLGGNLMKGVALSNGGTSQKSLISSISSLMQSCCIMLTHSYPVQVVVPVFPLLAIIKRVLDVNGSLPETLQPFTTAMQQEFVCLQLPALHINVLEVLAAVVKGLRSQILPHAAQVMLLLMKYLKTCSLPELRTKVYSIIRALLISMGSGMALYISEELIDNASVDLKFADSTNDGAPSDEQCVEVSLQYHRKKRKHGATTGLLMEQRALSCLEPKECQASIALKIASIETLEALLVMGGALICDIWRRRIDDLLMQVATKACRGGCIFDSNPVHLKETKSLAWEDFQLVALHALLASLLSPAGYRPPYLSKSLELLHRGKQNTGTKLANFCARALLDLEVLVHPRALPLTDMALPSGNRDFLGRTDGADPKYNLPNTNGTFRTGHGSSHDVYDFLNDIYMEDNPGSVIPGEVHKDMQVNHKLIDSMDENHEEPKVTNGSPDKVMTLEKAEWLEHANVDGNLGPNDGRVVSDVRHREEPNRTSPASVDISLQISSPLKQRLEGNISNGVSSDTPNRTSVSGRVEGLASTTQVENAVAFGVDSNRFKMSILEQDDESSDSFPDIVDADPDTDSDEDSG